MKGKRLKSFSGTVLIMILTVMLVLIIMLMATLTVVTTASQRIYTKYEENQAYYSARSALDVFTQNLLYDRTYYAYPDSGTSSPIQFTHGDGEDADMKQGLAMQLELYKIRTKDTDDADVPKSLQNLLQTEFYDHANDISVTGKDEYLSNFGVVATGSKTVGGKTFDTYDSAVVYEVEFPTLTSGTGGDGSGAHNFGEMSDKRKARITIEVLSREYDMSDDVVLTSDPTTKVKDKIASFGGDEDQIKTFLSTPTNYDDVVKAVANGSRKKDKMRLKITATTMLRGVEGTAVLICNSNEPPINNSSRAITAFGGANGTNHAYIVGGMSMISNPSNPAAPIGWSNGGGVYGTIYSETGLNFNVSSPIYLTEGEYIFTGGNLDFPNDSVIKAAVTDTSLDKRPFVFINGDLNVTNRVTIGGTGDEAVDVIVNGNFNFNGGSKFECNGNVYINGDCTLDSTAGTPNITGNMYVGGDVTAQGNCANSGTIKAGTNCTIYTTSGATIIAGKDSDNNDVKITYANSEGGPGGTYNPTDLVVPKMTDDMLNKTSTGKDKFEIKLPGSPSVTKNIETHKGNYDTYYYMDSDGNYTDADGGTSGTPVAKTAVSLAGTDFTDTANIPSGELTDAVITSGIDTSTATDGEVKYLVNSGKNFGGKKLRITGGGTVELFLKSGSYENGDIIVDDNTTLKIYGCNAGADYYFKGVRIWTTTMYEYYTHSDINADGVVPSSINVGMTAGHGIKVPKIHYYFEGGKFSTEQIGSNTCFFAGYFNGPDTNIWSQKSDVTFGDMYYFSGESASGAHVDAGWPFIFVGSILCKDYDFQNDQGVAYINPGLADSGDAGEPIHQWKAYQYTRN